MKGLIIPLLAILGIGIYAYSHGSDIAGKITYSFSPKFKFIKKGSGIFSTSFSFPLIITNNSTSQANLTAVIGTVYANGLLLGNYNISQPFELNPNQSTIVTLICRASNAEALRQLVLSVASHSLPSLRFEGRIYTTMGSLSFNEKV